jgi:mannose-6-phosphate isomerase-like protein (cupin superfamily)
MITKFNPASEFFTEERCHIVELFNLPDDNSCSVARCRIEPGVTTQLHSLRGITERYVILEGKGSVEVGREPAVEVGPMNVVHIPAGVSQRITNTGQTDLTFLCICTPRFRPEVYVSHEKTKI